MGIVTPEVEEVFVLLCTVNVTLDLALSKHQGWGHRLRWFPAPGLKFKVLRGHAPFWKLREGIHFQADPAAVALSS